MRFVTPPLDIARVIRVTQARELNPGADDIRTASTWGSGDNRNRQLSRAGGAGGLLNVIPEKSRPWITGPY